MKRTFLHIIHSFTGIQWNSSNVDSTFDCNAVSYSEELQPKLNT